MIIIAIAIFVTNVVPSVARNTGNAGAITIDVTGVIEMTGAVAITGVTEMTGATGITGITDVTTIIGVTTGTGIIATKER